MISFVDSRENEIWSITTSAKKIYPQYILFAILAEFKSKIMRAILLLVCSCLLSISLAAQDRITGKTFATRSEVIAQHGMAATSQPLATQVALDILKKGGNAVDASIAANAVLGLVEPTGNGIGGDLFAIIWDAENEKLLGLNASGRSPYKLTKQYFADQGMTKIPSHGPLPVSVPGAVDGWFEMHDRLGKLSMQEVLQPAIDYANNGFPVTELIAYYMELSSRFMTKYPGFEETYMPNGRKPRKGEVFKKPRSVSYTHLTLPTIQL